MSENEPLTIMADLDRRIRGLPLGAVLELNQDEMNTMLVYAARHAMPQALGGQLEYRGHPLKTMSDQKLLDGSAMVRAALAAGEMSNDEYQAWLRQSEGSYPRPIPVSERLPRTVDRYLVYYEDWGLGWFVWGCAVFEKGVFIVQSLDDGEVDDLPVTHWLPLPPAPEVE